MKSPDGLAIPRPLLAWQPHLRHITDTAVQRASPDAAYLANQLGFHLHIAADLAGAKHYYEQALAIRRERLGERHPTTATSLNNFGYVLRAQGDLEAAKRYFEQAVEILEERLDPNHPTTNIVRDKLKAVMAELSQSNERSKSID